MEIYIRNTVLLSTIVITFAWSLTIALSGLKQDPSKRYLLLAMLTCFFIVVMSYAKFNEFFSFYTTLFTLQTFAVLTVVPFIYFYVHSLLSKDKLHFKRHLIVPLFFMVLIFVVHKLWMTTNEETTYVREYMLSDNSGEYIKYCVAYFIYIIGKIFFIAITIFYFYKIYLLYKKHQKQVLHLFSTNSNADVKWIKYMGIFLSLSIILVVTIHLIGNRVAANQHILIAFSYLIFSIFYWLLGFNGFRQRKLYPKEVLVFETLKENETTPQYYRLQKDEFLSLIYDKKMHLNPEVSIYDFCYQLNTNRTYLSAMINKEFRKNFRTLINNFRINEAKELMSRNEDVSLDYIALQCGFQYYTTFSRVFKQFEGCSPMEYKEKLEKEKDIKNV